ncbi:MAG: transferrin-binding protein-like solute binding protein, partial [Alphaproteobacteria bacterium]|nr:transferrin-binding protein-like solute binding protein [Alphaproteobacteria bacterium]
DTEADLDGVSNTTTEANANTLNGAMIAGVETTNIPTENIIQFRGKGTGVYTSATQQYNTTFTAQTTVDFTDKTADFTTDNTACTGACSGITVPSSLNFGITGASFADGGNNAVNNIAFTEDTSARQVRFDARFYGSEAEELGGTFALHNKQGNYHYHGAFGGEESPIIFFEDKTTTIGFGNSSEVGNLTTNAFFESNETVIATSLVVHSNRLVNYSRANASDAWGVGELSAIKIETNNHHAATAPRIRVGIGSFSKIDRVDIYFDDKKYRSSKPSGTQSKYYSYQIDITDSTFGDSNDSANGFKDNIITLDAKSTSFDINYTTYLALVYWQLNENDPVMSSTDTSYSQQLSHGYAAVGVKATSDWYANNREAPTTFNGKSIGSYSPQGEIEATKLTESTITASVNFRQKTGTLTSKNTIGRGANDGETFSELDFTANLSTVGNKNKVSGIAQTDDVGANNLNMQGTIDARFYGNFASLIGGTFELRGNTGDIPATYIGAFGANE